MSYFDPDTGPAFKPYHTPKPWGEEFVWALTDEYAGKVLTILPGRRLSLQFHDAKDETILVLKGPVLLWHDAGSEPMEIEDGGVIHIEPGKVHRFGAGANIVTLIEVSTPQLKDVVRIEDDFDRLPEVIGEDDYSELPPVVQAKYEAIPEDEGPRLDACFRFIRRTAHRDFSEGS